MDEGELRILPTLLLISPPPSAVDVVVVAGVVEIVVAVHKSRADTHRRFSHSASLLTR